MMQSVVGLTEPMILLLDSITVVRVMMLSTLFASGSSGGVSSGPPVFFDFSRAEEVRPWHSINDRVMGGRSTGRLESTGQGTAVFAGEVSLANNGGFASIRSRAGQYDLRDHAGITLRVRGDGRRYKVNLKTEASFDGILYRVAFDTVDGQWTTVSLRFGEFLPTFRGRIVPDAPPLDTSRIVSFGLMISDKQAGPFRLEIASIAASPR